MIWLLVLSFPVKLYNKDSVQIQVNILEEKMFLFFCDLNKISLRKTLGLTHSLIDLIFNSISSSLTFANSRFSPFEKCPLTLKRLGGSL